MALFEVLDRLNDYAAMAALEEPPANEQEQTQDADIQVDKDKNVLKIPQPAVSSQKGVYNLESSDVSFKQELPSVSTTTTYNDYSQSPSLEEFKKARGYASFDEMAKSLGISKPDIEQAKQSQAKQNWLALAKSGGAALSQLADMVGLGKGASVRQKNYDLGEGNLQEAKREKALYEAKLQDYFRRAADYERAMQKDYSDFLNKSATKVSQTINSGKQTVTQGDSIKQALPKTTTIRTGGNSTDKPISTPSSYKDRSGVNTQYKMTYNSKDPNIFPNVYGFLSDAQNRKYLVETLGIDEKIFKSKSLFDFDTERVIEAKRSITINIIDKLQAEFWNNYNTYLDSGRKDISAKEKAENAGYLIDAVRKRGIIIE